MHLQNKKITKKYPFLRRVDKIIPSEKEFLRALSEKKLRFYYGIDPTASSLHLGHSVGLWFLQDMQKMGHQVIALIGNFTAQIGDPSDKNATRLPLSPQAVQSNMRAYRQQIGKLLDLKSARNPALIAYNARWLSRLRMDELIDIASRHSVQQFLERDMFQQRLKQGKAIALHEFLYPLLQGYDALKLQTGAQIGGTDQLFNMMIGRKMIAQFEGRESFVVTMRLLEDASTGKKMAKTEGTAIYFDASPDDLYGKIMALPDGMIWSCFELITNISADQIAKLKKSTKTGPQLRSAKALLAEQIVSWMHSPSRAKTSLQNFEKTFSRGHAPSKIRTIILAKGAKVFLPKFLPEHALARSRTEAIRLIETNSLQVNTEILTNWKSPLTINEDTIIRVGKKNFLKIRVAP